MSSKKGHGFTLAPSRAMPWPSLLFLVLAACTSSAPPNLYTLAARPGTEVGTHPLKVELRRVGLAGYLDRPEIVRGTVQYRLTVNDADRWGEPLGRMLDRVLTEDLVERLPQASVYAESGAISTRPDTVMEVDIQRCDADPDGSLVLLAQIAVRPDGAEAVARTVRLAIPIQGGSAQGHVAAMSEALGRLADTMASMLAPA